jgi:ABC-type dipeptide/oligopeptide/nickel transport system permease component
MATFLFRRTIYAVILLFIASLIIFYGMRLAPGNPGDVLLNPLNRINLIEGLSHKLFLDRPLWEQYLIFMHNLFTGQPGVSLFSGEPIPNIIKQAGLNTLKLALVASILTYVTAIPLGVLAAWKRNTPWDQGTMLLAVLGMGIPNFFLAILLIQLFGIYLKWLPVAGSDDISNIVLPAVVLSAEAIAVNLRLVRSSVLEELGRDYVRTLYAKGLKEWRIMWVHALRNALPPVIALAGIMLRTLLGYTLIVEVIFRWPGLGATLVDAVIRRDYSVAQVLALLLTFAVIVLNLLADIGQQLVDPRVREHAQAA